MGLWINLIKPKGMHAKWLIFITLIAILALGAGGYFDIVREYLDTESLTFGIGEYSTSLYKVLRALLLVAIIFWSTAIIIETIEIRINKIRRIRAATRTLLIKIFHIIAYIIAFLLTLDFIGIDLTTLTVFSGAVGIGLGFGLQKIASNFISGLILLLEKSVEQGDLIELSDGTFGFVRKSGARAMLIETFDTKEILVPNEDFITNRVVNWTLSNTKGRVEISLGVSYNSDLKKTKEILLQATAEHPSCIKDPEPVCYLRNFGDSSVDFTLFFWVDDVTQGRWGPKSEVMFSIWHKFKEHGIEIPFPQRDLHLKTSNMLEIKNNG